MNELQKIVDAENSNFTLEEVTELIKFLNDEKDLNLDETKQIISEAKPTEPDIEEEHLDHPHKPSTN